MKSFKEFITEMPVLNSWITKENSGRNKSDLIHILSKKRAIENNLGDGIYHTQINKIHHYYTKSSNKNQIRWLR